MTESKAYPTIINGLPTMVMRIELFTFIGSILRFRFSYKMFMLSDSFNSKDKDKSLHSRIVFGKKDFENISFLMKGTRSELFKFAGGCRYPYYATMMRDGRQPITKAQLVTT